MQPTSKFRFIMITLMTLAAGASFWSCRPRVTDGNALFGHAVPQSKSFREELSYLHKTGRISHDARAQIEQDLEKAQEKLGVPKTLLWCLLFQESRFDPLKNSNQTMGARGMGQFTQAALDEINEDTDQYDGKTGLILQSILHPKRLPLSFELRPVPAAANALSSLSVATKQARNSYFHPRTAIFASAAYLNNRYSQIKTTLDQKDIMHDPQVIWLYAAAAYNKGARTVMTLLSHQRTFGGDTSLSEILTSPKLSYALLTHENVLDYSLRDLWEKDTRSRYIKELTMAMDNVLTCAVPESRL